MVLFRGLLGAEMDLATVLSYFHPMHGFDILCLCIKQLKIFLKVRVVTLSVSF